MWPDTFAKSFVDLNDHVAQHAWEALDRHYFAFCEAHSGREVAESIDRVDLLPFRQSIADLLKTAMLRSGQMGTRAVYLEYDPDNDFRVNFLFYNRDRNDNPNWIMRWIDSWDGPTAPALGLLWPETLDYPPDSLGRAVFLCARLTAEIGRACDELDRTPISIYLGRHDDVGSIVTLARALVAQTLPEQPNLGARDDRPSVFFEADFNVTSVEEAVDALRTIGATFGTLSSVGDEIEYVYLERRPVRDHDLKLLLNLPALRVLTLDYTEITDLGLYYVGRLPCLESLSLSGTHVGDEGLRQLFNLRTLKALLVTDTMITRDGIRQLRERLPMIQVLPTGDP